MNDPKAEEAARRLIDRFLDEMGCRLPDAVIDGIADDVIQDVRLEVKQSLHRELTIEDYTLSERQAARLAYSPPRTAQERR